MDLGKFIRIALILLSSAVWAMVVIQVSQYHSDNTLRLPMDTLDVLEEKEDSVTYTSCPDILDQGMFEFNGVYNENKTIRSHSFVVPNIVHFVLLTKKSGKNFTLLNALSVLSAARYIKPETILFHGDEKPSGKWWQWLHTKVPALQFRYKTAATSIFGRPVLHMEHASDIARLEILLEFGGIYLDNDVLVFKSFDELRHYPCVMEEEGEGYALANGVIIAKRGSPFLRLWYEAYRSYNDAVWGEFSVMMAWKIKIIFPFLIHIMKTKLIVTPWHLAETQFKTHWNYTGSYSHHIWSRVGHVPNTEEDLKITDNIVGEMMRYIYFGRTDLIGPYKQSPV